MTWVKSLTGFQIKGNNQHPPCLQTLPIALIKAFCTRHSIVILHLFTKRRHQLMSELPYCVDETFSLTDFI